MAIWPNSWIGNMDCQVIKSAQNSRATKRCNLWIVYSIIERRDAPGGG
mgnify:CR=1 FL=1